MSSRDRVYMAGREIVAILEKNAEGARGAMAEGLEDDLESLNALMDELTKDQLNKSRLQDVLAHLLDHIIGELFDFGEGLPDEVDAALLDKLQDYMYLIELKINRKTDALRSEKLRLVLENFWDDSEDSDDEGGEGDDAGKRVKDDQKEDVPGQEEAGHPVQAGKEKLPPEQAEVEAEVEEGEGA